LIRRDDVEHLLMTGGPVDVVVETGISTARRSADAIMPPQQIAPRRPTIFERSKEPADRDTGTREL
jgi:flagellar protein FliO/FliZ